MQLSSNYQQVILCTSFWSTLLSIRTWGGVTFIMYQEVLMTSDMTWHDMTWMKASTHQLFVPWLWSLKTSWRSKGAVVILNFALIIVGNSASNSTSTNLNCHGGLSGSFAYVIFLCYYPIYGGRSNLWRRNHRIWHLNFSVLIKRPPRILSCYSKPGHHP